MADPLNVLVLVASEDSSTRRRFLNLVKQASDATPEYTIKTAPKTSLEKVSERLAAHYGQPGRRGAVVLSDLLHLDDVAPTASSGAKELLDHWGDRLYTTIAIMDRSASAEIKSPPDIDRVVARDCDAAQLQNVLKLCLAKLTYLARPPRRQLANNVDVRVIGNQTELLRYFKLRHEVYTSMSYLSPLVEGVQSRLDIDWFDTRSIHIGAFEQYLGHEELIGTARLITTEPLHPQHPHWTRQLAGLDPVLERLVNEGAVQAMLPVFQSQDLEGELHQAIRGGILVGELSRVIVHPNCRGAGLSQRLVHKVIELAEKARVGSLYLECLPIHEGLYQRVGFSTLPVRGKVYVVNKTMMVMRLMLSSGVPALKVLPAAHPQ